MFNKDRSIAFARPFIESAKNVFETMAFTKLEAHQAAIKENNISRGDITSMIGLNGECKKEDGTTCPYSAVLAISWPMDSYLKTASAMLMEEYPEFCEDVADVGAEICNVIMGNTKRVLSEQGYTTSMAVPSTIKGDKHYIRYPNGTKAILFTAKSNHGMVYMEICYVEG